MSTEKRNMKKAVIACLCAGAIAAGIAAVPAVTDVPDMSIEADADVIYVPVTVPTSIPTEVPTTITTTGTARPVVLESGDATIIYDTTQKPTGVPTTVPTTSTSYMGVNITVPSAIPSSVSNDNKIEGETGWNNISDKIKETADGGKINVDMNGTTNLPKNILTDISGRNIDLILDMGNGITWTINGKGVTDPKDIDLNIKPDTDSIPIDVINNVTGEKKSIQLSLSHNGDFGFTAILTIDLGASNNGYYANLFYYNPKTGKLEFIDYSEISKGKANLVFTHASDWAIIIDKEPLTASEDVSSEAGIVADRNDIEENGNKAVFIIPAIAAAVLGASAFAFRRKARR